METPKVPAENTPPEEKKPEGEETKQETVTLTKKEHEQLKMNKNLTANLQEENARLRARKPGKKVVAPKSEFSFEEEEEEEPASKPLVDEDRIAQQEEFVRMKNLVNSEISQNPKHLQLMGEDSILRRVIASNPLSLLTPQEQADVRDAEDAVAKINAALDERVSKTEPEPKKSEPEGSKPPEGTNPDSMPGTPPAKPERKPGMDGVEQSILGGIKQD